MKGEEMSCKPESKKEKKIRSKLEIETMNARNELLEKIYSSK